MSAAIAAAIMACLLAGRRDEEEFPHEPKKKAEKPIDLGTYVEYKSIKSVEAFLEKNKDIGIDG